MYGINKVYLVGHLGADPESHLSRNGKGYARISLATNRTRKREDGTQDKLTDWHNVTVWGKQGEACLNHLQKGSKLMVEGFLSHFDSVDKHGETRKLTGITAHNVEFFKQKQTLTLAA